MYILITINVTIENTVFLKFNAQINETYFSPSMEIDHG